MFAYTKRSMQTLRHYGIKLLMHPISFFYQTIIQELYATLERNLLIGWSVIILFIVTTD